MIGNLCDPFLAVGVFTDFIERQNNRKLLSQGLELINTKLIWLTKISVNTIHVVWGEEPRTNLVEFGKLLRNQVVVLGLINFTANLSNSCKETPCIEQLSFIAQVNDNFFIGSCLISNGPNSVHPIVFVF
jgi:hypothetical protein